MAVRKVSTKIVKSLDEEAEPVLLLGQSRLREVVETSIDPVAGARDITTTVGDGAVKGGDDSNVHTSNVAIPGMNEEPAGADNLDVAVNEDGTYTFAVSDFGFTDSDGNAFAGVAIITLPATGTLFHNGVAITSAPMGGYFVSAADLAANLFTYVPALNGSGDDYASFTFAVRDDGGTDNGGVDQDSSPNTFSFDVAAVNDDPTIGNLNGDTASFTEGGSLFSAMLDAGLDTTISDVDSANFAGGSLRVQITNAVAGQDFIYFNNSNPAFGLTFSGNTLSYNGVAFATFTAPSADRTFTFDADATPQAVQSLVRSLAYFNSNTANPSTVTRTVNLTLNDGSGGATTVSTSVDIVAVNDAPVNAVPGAQNGTEDSNLLFSTGNGNAISVSDVDAATLTVTLTVANGLLTLSGTAGLSFSVGDGANDATMTFTGTAAAINTALDGLIYRGDLNYSGGDTLTVTTNDNGLTGADPGASGGATDEQDVDTVTITLAADGVISGDGNDNTVSGTAGADVYDLSQGGDDTVSGLGGDDGFYFGAAYTSADTVDGGAGSLDQIGLQGNYGSTTLGAMTGVEQLVL
ncbi:MAG: beta strand repeat-containing protein, partial [Brevundimonas sp.]